MATDTVKLVDLLTLKIWIWYYYRTGLLIYAEYVLSGTVWFCMALLTN